MWMTNVTLSGGAKGADPRILWLLSIRQSLMCQGVVFCHTPGMGMPVQIHVHADTKLIVQLSPPRVQRNACGR